MIKRLLQLSGLAIINVVLFHAAGMSFVAMFAWAHRYLPADVPASQQVGSLSYYYLRVIEQFVVFSIPAFLFVSGYFISVAAGRTRTTVAWNVVWTRIKHLLIPYLIWSAVILGLLFLQNKSLSIKEIFLGLVIGKSNEVMYYIPLLTQFYLISPLLVWFVKRNWKLALAVAAIIQLAVILLPYPVLLGLDVPNKAELARLIPKWFFPSRIFWFTLGIAFGLNLTLFKQFVHKYAGLLLAIALICLPLGIVEWEYYFRLSGEVWLAYRETLVDTLYSLAVILGVLGIQKTSFPSSDTLSDLGVRSYGIYLIHSIIVIYLAKTIYHVAPWLLAHAVIFQIFLFVMGLGVPLLIMWLVNRSALRKYYKYLFG